MQLAEFAIARGDVRQALTLQRQAVALGDNRARMLSRLGCLEATTGEPDSARDTLRLLRDMDASGSHVPDDALAPLLAWTGAVDEALALVRRSMNQHQEWVSDVVSAKGCWSPLRDDPRWPALAEELKQITWLPPGGHVYDPGQ